MSDVGELIEAPPPQASACPASPGFAPAHSQRGGRLGMLWSMLDVAGTAASEIRLNRNHPPPPIEVQLQTLCSGIVDRFADRAQTIRLEIAADGDCPADLESVVLDIVRHSVRHAVQYGMRLRLIGRVCVHLLSRDGTATLTISHDGWDCHDHPRVGDGRYLAEQLARRYGGCVTLYRGHMATMEVRLRHQM